jgi:hypothetical protein
MTIGGMRQPKFPFTVRVEGIPGISCKIYKQTLTIKGAVYPTHLLSYYAGGKRKRLTYPKFEDAKAAAEEIILQQYAGEPAATVLRAQERHIYQRALAALTPTGVALDLAALEFAEARRLLGQSGTIAEAVGFYLSQRSKELPQITVEAAVTQCLESCLADGKSATRMHQLRSVLTPFAEAMNVGVSEITPSILSGYLSGLDLSERSKKNVRDVLGYFGRWCVLHGYLPPGKDILENVQSYRTKTGVIEIFTPAEMELLIRKAPKSLVPYLAIGAWAGLRGMEIQRLDWAQVDLKGGFIEVTAENAKTDVRRIVPIKPNLAEWLKPHAKSAGPVVTLKNITNALVRLVTAVNKAKPADAEPLEWHKNGLRHSAISYRVAECADLARVADESGNSPSIIKSNYLRRVRPDAATAWFAITP